MYQMLFLFPYVLAPVTNVAVWQNIIYNPIFGPVSYTHLVRLIRSVVMTVAEQDYIRAAKSYGTSNARIIFRYVLPNAMGPIIVNTTMSISGMILSAAGLSFIGMGIQPPSPEWGALLSGAQKYMFTSPYLLFFPGVFILLASLAFNLVGDGLTDALDPKLKD